MSAVYQFVFDSTLVNTDYSNKNATCKEIRAEFQTLKLGKELQVSMLKDFSFNHTSW